MLIVRETVDVKDDPLGNTCNISSLPQDCKSAKGCIISAIEDMVRLPFARGYLDLNLIGSRQFK